MSEFKKILFVNLRNNAIIFVGFFIFSSFIAILALSSGATSPTAQTKSLVDLSPLVMAITLLLLIYLAYKVAIKNTINLVQKLVIIVFPYILVVLLPILAIILFFGGQFKTQIQTLSTTKIDKNFNMYVKEQTNSIYIQIPFKAISFVEPLDIQTNYSIYLLNYKNKEYQDEECPLTGNNTAKITTTPYDKINSMSKESIDKTLKPGNYYMVFNIYPNVTKEKEKYCYNKILTVINQTKKIEVMRGNLLINIIVLYLLRDNANIILRPTVINLTR